MCFEKIALLLTLSCLCKWLTALQHYNNSNRRKPVYNCEHSAKISWTASEILLWTALLCYFLILISQSLFVSLSKSLDGVLYIVRRTEIIHVHGDWDWPNDLPKFPNRPSSEHRHSEKSFKRLGRVHAYTQRTSWILTLFPTCLQFSCIYLE